MQEKKGMPGWLKGCLTGCGILTIVVMLVLTFVCMKLRSVVSEAQHAERTFEQLAEELGDYEDYAPSGEISLASDRVELFLRIREEMAAEREALSRTFREFPIRELKDMDRDGAPPPAMIWAVMKRFASLINPVGEFIANRNEILLRERMSLGEYSWIYSLVFYSWLGHDMDAAPRLGGEEITDWGEDGSPVSPDTQRRRYRRVMLHLLTNRLDGLPDEAADLKGPLERELRRVENSPGAIVWESGLPAGEEKVLGPFRERLEATWHPDTNVLELPFEDRSGQRFRFNVD